jgi:hypothetical protein
LFFNVFDRYPQKKITYFKKIKEQQNESDTDQLLANALELSQREIGLYNDVLTSLKSS